MIVYVLTSENRKPRVFRTEATALYALAAETLRNLKNDYIIYDTPNDEVRLKLLKLELQHAFDQRNHYDFERIFQAIGKIDRYVVNGYVTKVEVL